jgi:hypothetical protein
MTIEVIEDKGVRFAEVIRVNASVSKTTFYSPAESAFQFGLLAHKAGFVEPAHRHKAVVRQISDLQQMFVVQRGVVAVDFFDARGAKVAEVTLRAGDAINLVHGAHSVRVIEDMQCISVKQGPFLGDENDKVDIKTIP